MCSSCFARVKKKKKKKTVAAQFDVQICTVSKACATLSNQTRTCSDASYKTQRVELSLCAWPPSAQLQVRLRPCLFSVMLVIWSGTESSALSVHLWGPLLPCSEVASFCMYLFMYSALDKSTIKYLLGFCALVLIFFSASQYMFPTTSLCHRKANQVYKYRVSYFMSRL